MAQHFVQIAFLTFLATSIGVNGNEVEEVCGDEAAYECDGDFTQPNPCQWVKTCKALVDKENAERNANNILIKFRMLNYNQATCEEFNDRINNNKNLLKSLHCDQLKTTTSSCSHETPEPPIVTTQEPCTKTTSQSTPAPCTQTSSKPPPETTPPPCTKTSSKPPPKTTAAPCLTTTPTPCMATTPQPRTPIQSTSSKKLNGTTKKRRKGTKKKSKTSKKPIVGQKPSKKPKPSKTAKPSRKPNASKKPGKKIKKTKIVRKKKHPGVIGKNPNNSIPAANPCSCEESKPSFQQ